MEKEQDLKRLRREIDKIDSELLRLMSKRAKKALEIGRVKAREEGEYYSPEREREVYEGLEKENKGPLSTESLKSIYREILSATLSVQQPIKVVYLGPEATFTHLAARERFGSSVKYLPVKSISDVFTEVEKGRSNYGVVPIENSAEGIVTHTLDMFAVSDLKICSEILLGIAHHLLSREPSSKKIHRIYSHAQALAQCRVWLESNFPRVELVEVSSTAEAARLAAQEKGAGAIGSELAAGIYGLKILGKDIEDSKVNVTRFLVIGRRMSGKSGSDKTSIMCSIHDKVGTLYSMLQPFKENKINLTKIESRPSRMKAWDYYFFIDFEGHCEDAKAKRALKRLEQECAFMKILGSYPREK